jgi:hypothetical protein
MKHKIKLSLTLFVFTTQFAFGQLPNIIHNYTGQDSSQNPVLDSFTKKYDLIIAYSEQSWGIENIKILSCAGNKWSSWTYSNYFIQGTIKKGTKEIITDTVKTGHFFKGKTKLKNSAVLELLSRLDSDLWTLNNDSLNQSRLYPFRIRNGDTIFRTASVFDDIYYRFDVSTRSRARVIASYAPDHFLELFPDMTERRKFVNSREIFLSWWDKYCH